MNGAQVLVKLLEKHGVTHVFGIPGAKVDSVSVGAAA
jgi:acetolactate synthase I/II/III large subunit